MLKFRSPLQIETGKVRTKCGEIHFQTSSFSFLCMFCGVNLENYNEFKIHFEIEHFNELVHSKLIPESSAEKMPINEDFIPVKENLEDPLDWNIQTLFKETTVSNSIPTSNLQNEEILNEVESKIIAKTMGLGKINQSDTVDGTDTPDETESATHTDNGSTNSDNRVDWNRPYQPRSLNQNKKRPYKAREKPNECTYCGRIFRRRYQLDTHINIHTGAKPHQCEICGRQFRAVTTLQRHLSTHEQRSIFVCKFCYKSFTHKAALLSHESRHTQERNVPCDECEKRFYTINQCDTHKRRVHKRTNETLPFACDLCSNRYRTASMLSTHKKRKHYKTAKFTCEKCEKKFINPQKLEEHQLIHIDGPPILTNT